MSKTLLWIAVAMYGWVAIEQWLHGNRDLGGMYAGYCFAAIFAARMAV